MSEEEIREVEQYNLEYMEAMLSEDVFGGDYTSAVDLRYANKQIEKLQQENKQLRNKLDKINDYIDFNNDTLHTSELEYDINDESYLDYSVSTYREDLRAILKE